jgi:Ala-tRNA(Pro) deacylase
MLPGDKVFKTSELSKKIGSSRLSFASPEYMEQFLDITPGSVSVLGLMNDRENRVQLLIDEDVLNGEYIGCHPCINTSSLRLKTLDLINTILPALGHGPRLVTLERH